ncbi:MAG: SCO family protein [Bacteroidetes bacterium]|nr:SCO family protein [Bacteroidota bacterium]
MKNSIYIFVVALATIFVSCQSNAHRDQHNLIPEEQVDSFPETSIFNIEHKWLNQFGDTIQLKDLAGQPIVMAMIYTSCNFSCPRIVADMREIESLVPNDQVDDIHFVLISIDPEVDQPDTLKAFMIKNVMDENRWTLLTGTTDQIQDIAAVLGFKYKKSTLMDYAHSNLITEFDKQGNWLHQTEGFDGDKKEIVRILLEAL